MLQVPPVSESEKPDAMLEAERGDVALYRAIVERMQAGQGYYAAVAVEQPARNYPTTPFVTWRLPTMAMVLDMLGEADAARLLQVLAVITVLLWLWVLIRAGVRRWMVLWAGLLLATGVVMAFPVPAPSLYLHETWAGVLIALSLGLRQSARPLAVLAGFAAMACREHAVLFVAVMGFCALLEGQRREALGWVAAMLAFALYLAAHAWQVAEHVGTDALESSGWLVLGGWEFVLQTAQWNVVVLMAGPWLAAVAMPLVLLGSGAWVDPLGHRLGLTVVGYTLAFMIIGRPDNDYWGILCAPLIALSLAFAPAGLRGLWQAAQASGRG
ncbi:MAG: hypothetical protein GVY22_07610 [Gammaproteobacteria bacterium]|nr:hypothetical protein [Gammaproteobacteria bacterium]